MAVIIPTHNRPDLLRATLGSVLAQREVEVEVVIVDDGSRRVDARSVRALEQEGVRVLRNERSRGVAAARNQGAEAARSTWVAFCDDDDLWTASKLSGQVSAARAARSSWSYSGAVKFEDGPIVWQLMRPPEPETLTNRLPQRNVIPAGASNVLVARNTFLDLGGFDVGLKHLADWDMWLRLLEHGPPACQPVLSVCYRMHPGAMSLSPDGILDDLRVIDERWRHLRQGQPLDFGPTHLWIGLSQLRAGRRLRSSLAYARALRTGRLTGLIGLLHTMDPRLGRSNSFTALDSAAAKAVGFARIQRSELSDELWALLDDLAANGSSPGPALL